MDSDLREVDPDVTWIADQARADAQFRRDLDQNTAAPSRP
jgi:hypothetical protein